MAKFSRLFYTLFFILSVSHISRANIVYNVINFGAKPDGKTDSTPAFLNAWSAACASSDSSTINVPKGRYLIGSLAFKGECKSSDIAFQIDGTLVATADYRVLGQASNWLSFEGVSGVTIIGGALDAKGSGLWACKAAGTNCPSGATTLSFTNSYNIRINGLLSLNSQMYHIVFNGCQNVHVERIKIIASGDSPNTDGIHVQLSSNVVIVNSTIKTGDDCISIGPGTKNLWIEHIKCGPGHGISIGSLAKDMEEAGVQNVTVSKAIFIGTQNGLRIKSWARPSSGFVQRVRFLGAVMQNVQNPIVIDQNYCPHNINCPGQVSGVKISDVLYQDIRGTSATQIAIKFDCSAKNPCTGIRIENVNLIYPNQVAQSFCTNAIGKTLGSVQPNGCL
ncbi:polygalacturonase-like [Quercus robur]|uniref:polygalacturonase-like n=1 Tax=Quercus robur TaxID=38942 RepID=UPI002163080B|nr:polygalacturonase-like [Quercus robur]